MSTDNKDILSNYLSRVLELQRSRQEELTQEELRSIAREVGVTDADLEYAENQAEAHLQRGLGYIKHKLLNEAFAELESALQLAPYRLEINRALVEANFLRWQMDPTEVSPEQTEMAVRRYLELVPDDDKMYAILQDLKQPMTRRLPPPAGKQGPPRAVLLGALLAGLFLTLLVLAFVLLSQ